MKRVWILDTSEESATPLVRSLPSLMYETSVWTEPTSFLSALDNGLPDLVVIEHGIGGAAAVDILRDIKGRLANLAGFYMPGRDSSKALCTIGWTVVLASLLGVVLHALGRVFTAGRKEE